MTEHVPTDTDQETAARMLALNGLTPGDIARTLGLHEQQVRDWLGTTRHGEHNGDDE